MNSENENRSEAVNTRIIDFLLELPLFDSLHGEELGIVARHIVPFKLQENTFLFKEGERGDYVCFVLKGNVNIYKRSEKGRNMLIATLPKGSTIGEMAIIDETSRSATVKAPEEVHLLILSRKGFDEILENHPGLGIKILKGIARLLSLNMRRTSSLLADCVLKLKEGKNSPTPPPQT